MNKLSGKNIFSLVDHKNTFVDFIIILILGLLSISWFRGNFLIKAGDSFFSLSPLPDLIRSGYVWDHIFSTGIPSPRSPASLPYGLMMVILNTIFSLVTSQKILVYSLFTLSGIGMYYLSSTIVNNKNGRVIGLFSAFFYMMNPFALTNVWGTGLITIIFAYPLLPLMLGLLIKWLSSKNFRYLSLILLLWIIFSIGASNPAFAIPIFLVLFSYIGFYIWEERKNKVNILYALKCSILLLLLVLVSNCWWILPSILSLGQQLEIAKVSGTPLEIFLGSSKFTSILNCFRLLGMWTLHFEYFEPYFTWSSTYFTPVFIIISFLILILVFIPLLFIVKMSQKRGVLFFTIIALAGLFIIKGAHSPLGDLNIWLFQNIPLAAMFRNTYEKFGMVFVVSYAFLLGTSINYFYGYVKKSNYYARILFLIVILLIFNVVYAFPFWTGDVIYPGGKIIPSYRIQVPEYYEEAARWINRQEKNFRIITLPAPSISATSAYAWRHGYVGSDPLVQNFFHDIPFVTMGLTGNSYIDGLQRQLVAPFYGNNVKVPIVKLLGLINIKYILFHRDFNVKYSNSPPLKQFKDAIANQKGIKLEKSFDKLDFYKVSDEYFLPHFYTPQNIIYSNGEVESLVDIVGFEDYEKRSGIFLADNADKSTENTEKARRTLKSRADEIFVKANLENKVSEEELGMAVKPEELFLPYVRQKPGSLFYSLVLKKEKYDKWKVRKDSEKSFEKHLFYASKRVAELGKWGEEKDIGYWILDIYQKEMEGALGVLKELKQDKDKDFVKLLAKYEGTLWGQREKIKELENLTDRNNTFQELEGQAEELKTKRDFSKLAYKFEIPKSGNYSLFIKNAENADVNAENAEGERRGRIADGNNGGWTDLGERSFEEGKQELTLPFSGISENLIDENLRIKDYSPNSIYRISFDYQAPRGGSFFVAEGKTGETAETQLSSTGDEFGHFEMFFKSYPDVQEASIHLSISVSEEKNLRIERIYQPGIMLRLNADDTDGKRITPKITFVKINPTKYRVKVEGAVDPYTLIFSESFHQGWRLYITENAVNAENADMTADSADNRFGPIVASYFDGEIKEGTHKNIFLDKNTFETWRKKPILEEQHLLVNGYANSWYITPEDAGGRQDYELIIEFWPQRLFYIGLGISLITLIGCITYLAIPRMTLILRRGKR